MTEADTARERSNLADTAVQLSDTQSTLFPMLTSGLVLFTIGMIAVLTFS